MRDGIRSSFPSTTKKNKEIQFLYNASVHYRNAKSIVMNTLYFLQNLLLGYYHLLSQRFNFFVIALQHFKIYNNILTCTIFFTIMSQQFENCNNYIMHTIFSAISSQCFKNYNNILKYTIFFTIVSLAPISETSCQHDSPNCYVKWASIFVIF